MMAIRVATPEDIDEILRIYACARQLMVKAGNPTQWKDGYPRRELVEQDIASQASYVMERNGLLCGVFAFFVGNDPTYDEIDGAWLNDAPYGTIHRIGSDGTQSGVFAEALEFCKQQGIDLRIDTHDDNAPMRHVVEKAGFVYCGTIICDDGTPRRAYHLVRQ